jgi:aryl-alcohol dehydrogenase-like predicted oxidoreductase
MNSESSRRRFLQAGLALPAAGLVSQQTAAAFQQTPPMPQRTLGKTGIKVCPVGFGSGFTPDPAVVARAVDLGVNYFDTSNDYSNGNSERLLGAGLKGIRNKAVVVSKTPARTKTSALANLDDSLKNLATDHLDIWLLHARDRSADVPDELLEAAAEAKKQGKTRFFGLSTHNLDAMADTVLKANLDVVLFSYNFTMGQSRDAAIAKLHTAGVGLAAMKVMAATGGFPGMPGAGAARGGALPARPAPLHNPLPALKWVVKNPSVATTIPGIRDAEMLEMNLRALTEPYGPADDKVLVARSEEVRPYYCRMCFRCEGQCPHGVPVAEQLRILAYADFYGDFPLARNSFLRLPEEVRAVRCSDCSTCAVDCPNGVHVADRLIRAQELLA